MNDPALSSRERRPFLAEFESLYAHGFARIAVAIPRVHLAAPEANAAEHAALAEAAAREGAVLVVFPELGLSGYSNDDLFHQDALLDAVEEALRSLLVRTRDLEPILLVGAPLRHEAKLFNCALVLRRGEILGVVPKTFLPNYREFYERRQFAPAGAALARTIALLGREVPFGNDLLFEIPAIDGFVLHAEICEDLWTPVPPSTWGALAGATVLANLSASNATVGKADWRRLICAAQSGKCVAAYL